MTVTLASIVPVRYVGVVADTKPTTGVDVGSTFVERDTGLTYVWDGSAWGALNQSLGGLSVVTITPTITAGAYNATTKNSIGGKQTLA